MIRVEDKYEFKFSVGTSEDFLRPEDVEMFKAVESADASLPRFEAQINVRDESICAYLHEGSTFIVKYKDLASGDDEQVSSYLIAKAVKSKSGQGNTQFYLAGTYRSPKFVKGTQTKIFVDKKSTEVMTELASNAGLTPALKDADTDDKMNWIQWGVSHKDMLLHVWRHSAPEKSALMIGITSNGEFRVRNFANQIKEDPKYKFIPGDSTDSYIHIDGDYCITSQSGIMNSLFAYDKKFNQVDQISGELTELESKITADSSPALNRTEEMEPLFAGERPHNPNVHKKFWPAYYSNAQKLAAASSLLVEFSFSNIFYNVRLLDTIKFVEGKNADRQQDQQYSGNYVVSKVTRILAGKTLATLVMASRESMSKTEGGGIN